MRAGNPRAATAAAFAVACTLAGLGSFGVASATAADLTVQRVEDSPAEIRSQWSESEMLAAAANGAPSPGPQGTAPNEASSRPVLRSDPAIGSGDFTPLDSTAWPYRVHGKLFFTSQGEAFSCSGTLVDSAGRNVVATAGHCLYDREARSFVKDLIFAPAWNGNADNLADRTPFGTFAARKLVTTNDFRLAGQLGVDVAFFTVAGEPARDIGSRKIAFDLDLVGKPVTILGYPAKPTSLFDGRELKGCASTVVDRDAGRGAIFPAALWAKPCSMGAGSSGGGWITSGGFLASVVSYGYCPGNDSLCGSTFGPVFREAAEELYTSDAIGGSRRPLVEIVEAPSIRTLRRSVTFEFTGSGSTPVSLRCQLDDRPRRECPGRASFRNLDRGRHVFQVKAIDQTGKQSQELTRAFTVLGQ